MDEQYTYYIIFHVGYLLLSSINNQTKSTFDDLDDELFNLFISIG